MSRCEDCGCRTSGGVCSNCHEELYIVQNQGEHIERPLSKDFLGKVDEQQEIVNKRNQEERERQNRVKQEQDDNVDK